LLDHDKRWDCVVFEQQQRSADKLLMVNDSDRVGESAEGRSPDTVDRLMVGACAAIWLGLLAVTVMATVALVDMGKGHTFGSEEKGTPWLLYSVIVVSALIILGAIPLLLRARRDAQSEPAPPVIPENRVAGTGTTGASVSSSRSPAAAATEAPTEKIRIFGSTVDPSVRYQPDYAQSSASRRADPLIPATELDRLWLRCTVSLGGAIGLALAGSEAATYLLAVGKDTGAWVALGLAGVITAAMPIIPVLYLRQLRSSLESAASESA
jgi:hypothetical protein